MKSIIKHVMIILQYNVRSFTNDILLGTSFFQKVYEFKYILFYKLSIVYLSHTFVLLRMFGTVLVYLNFVQINFQTQISTF